MKKYLLVATITLGAVFNVSNVFSQGLGGGGCPQEELVKRYTEITDSIARFLNNLKNTTSDDEYTNFTGALETDSIDAFDAFGSRSAGLKDSMNALIDSLNSYLDLLRTAIDPYNLMPVAEFNDTLSSRITCFLSDTTINTLGYLFDQCFGTGEYTNRAIGEGGPGPCENALYQNLVSANQNYQLGIIGCGIACNGAPFRFICFGVCMVPVSVSYNTAVQGYLCVYSQCVHRECFNL